MHSTHLHGTIHNRPPLTVPGMKVHHTARLDASRQAEGVSRVVRVSLKDGQAPNEPVRAHAEVLVIDPVLLRVHRDERVAYDVFKERTRVDLAEDETERVRNRVAQHDELVA